MTKKRVVYDTKFRLQAVKRARELRSAAAAAKELKVPARTVQRWVRRQRRPDPAERGLVAATLETDDLPARLEAGAMRFYDEVLEHLVSGNYSARDKLHAFRILLDRSRALAKERRGRSGFGQLEAIARALEKGRG